MADRRNFQPRSTTLAPEELDRIEDALENLEDDFDRDESPEVNAELEQYREILQMSRQALPLVDPPSGALDRVLQAARAEAARGEQQEVESSSVPQASRWQRWRRTIFLPGLAFAGTAALILLWVRPRPEDAEPAYSEVTAKASESAPAPAMAAPASPGAAYDDAAVPTRESERFEAAVPAEAGAAALEEKPVPTSTGVDAKRSRSSTESAGGLGRGNSSARKGASGTAATAKKDESGIGGLLDPTPTNPPTKPKAKTSSAPSSAPAQQDRADAEEEEQRDEGRADPRKALERADALRYADRCDEAVPLYRQALESDAPAVRKAASYGLDACLSYKGSKSAPQK